MIINGILDGIKIDDIRNGYHIDSDIDDTRNGYHENYEKKT